MAVGGMIGGGIFSVLGVAITLAGHLAFGCFVLGAVVAGITARSYAGVTLRAGTSGGAFDHLRSHGHAGVAGVLLWLLVFGYMVAMAVYTFTFGRYAANALGAPVWGARLLSIGVVVLFLAVNLRGVRLSSLTEDMVVLTKLVVLFTISIVGLAEFSAVRLSPLADSGAAGLLLGTATVFFAYEGFELISYDIGDMEAPRRTLPRALFLSVAIVAAVYITVTIGAQMLVSDHAIVASKEIAFIAVGEAALGGFGRWAAIVGAVFATGSAINATLFSAARLVRDASAAGDVPGLLGRERGGLPAYTLIFISVVGATMAMLPGITAVIAFGSAAFLAVYTLVNYLQATMGERRRDRVLGWLGVAACVGALVALVYELAGRPPRAGHPRWAHGRARGRALDLRAPVSGRRLGALHELDQHRVVEAARGLHHLELVGLAGREDLECDRTRDLLLLDRGADVAALPDHDLVHDLPARAALVLGVESVDEIRGDGDQRLAEPERAVVPEPARTLVDVAVGDHAGQRADLPESHAAHRARRREDAGRDHGLGDLLLARRCGTLRASRSPWHRPPVSPPRSVEDPTGARSCCGDRCRERPQP